MTAVVQYDSFFEHKRYAAGRVGISSPLNVTSALRVLAYASSFDSIDENLEMSETTVKNCVQHFCVAVIAVFSPEYLRPPTPSEIRELLEENAKRGFVGMVESIDCMHWTWKNCPMAVAGQHKGKEKKPNKVLEAVAGYKLRIWHYNFGSPGSLNDLNILEQSPVFDAILRGEAATVHYEINGHAYNTPYLLADGIYPSWPVFVKSTEKTLGLKCQHFARMQEACRKDVERCFGVLQVRWYMLDTPCRLWSANDVETVMKACVILHNMIVVDEIDIDPNGYLFDPACQSGGMPVLEVSRPPPFSGLPNVDALVLRRAKQRDK
ncbi:hypothetical protein PF002_g22338 [Phytophthora fragariae]|uniref:DDE Tnp4 domain-containing protein n=1 Tax=Phytophthora fragariae TaxID=53985 RepID=A0A6A3RCD1_9STRA|nr:hypothetical protein PF003_g11180 [Phytophthora fragariae]KAE8929393.1 hypothetical protein PF009_g20490 [Phytophthora fragariae]KAE9077197.1 hypothetical protein PF007_g24335 [Phytophthora fragariae]KAE9093707.1 hypothetical protein PF006_g24374 [Phytophthora fragariae]KAE9196178.1 hypothetical protein PF004_g20215 [Phytophthora fragariae]